MKQKLNLGCEKEYRKGWVNLDFDKKFKADVYHDLNETPYPFEENQFDEILASMVLEHLDNVYDAMMELYRISKHNGLIYIMCPYFSSFMNDVELEHKHGFCYMTFGEWYFNKELYPYFEVIKKKIFFTRCNFTFLNPIINPLINLFPRVYERLFSCILPASGMVLILKVRKDKKFVGEKKRFLEEIGTSTVTDNLKFIKEI